MNCEKCKNRKATLFYADEGGRRHALCAVCGASLGKAVVTEPIREERPQSYIPEPTLTSLVKSTYTTCISQTTDPADKTAVCRGCGTTLEEAISGSEVGCPECYECFGARLFPAVFTGDTRYSAKMPSARRSRLERERRLNELRVELRRAVDSECFELAATIRDKIRELEKQH